MARLRALLGAPEWNADWIDYDPVTHVRPTEIIGEDRVRVTITFVCDVASAGGCIVSPKNSTIGGYPLGPGESITISTTGRAYVRNTPGGLGGRLKWFIESGEVCG